MRRLLSYMKPHLWLFIFGSLFMVAEAVGEIVLPYFMRDILEVGVPNHDSDYIIAKGISMAAVALAMLVAQLIGTKLCVKGSMRLGRDMRQDVFAKMQEFSASDMDEYSEPSLVMRLTNDVTQVQNVVLSAAKIILKAPALLILGCVMAFSMNQDLSVILIVAMPLMAIVVIFLSARSFPKFGVMQHALDDLNGKIQENLVNVRVVKAFVRGNYEIERFKGSNEELKDSSTKAYTMSVTITPVITLIMNATVVIVIWFGGNMILENRMDIGTLQAYAAYVLEILAALQVVGLVIVDSTRAVASFRRMSGVLDEEIDLASAENANKELAVTDGRVEFKDVTFRYFKNNPNQVIEHISFCVEPGQTLGIIGSTGSGKSTIASLIPRLYDVDEGSVLVDGHDVREYTTEALRQGIGFVPQKNLLFSGTVAGNIRWGDPNATDDAVREAAMAAQADSFVSSFEGGYEAELEHGGGNVSGGQKQRLCIARALVRNPKILIMDDSTSAVDLATERSIRETLGTSYNNTTVVIIAQRITSVQEADNILVLDDGKIVGLGKHDDLLKTCTTYAEINASQAGGVGE